MTLYAKWTEGSGTPATHTVTFDTHGGSAVASQTVNSGDTATKPADPTRAGYTFDGWYTDAAYTTKFDFDTPITAPRTIYAKWTPLLLSFTVDFDVDGGSTVSSQTVIEGGKVTKPDGPTKEGYSFAGWFANGRKTRSFDFDNTEIYADTTIYAKWIVSGTQRYEVLFMYGSRTLDNQKVYSGGYATRPTSVHPPEHGVVFVDWYADPELTTLFDFENTPITANTRIYSKWIEGYVVTFEPNNGGHLIEINVEGGKTVTKPDDPMKEGFTFGGWYRDYACTDEFDFTTPITEDIKLYAKWTESSSTAYPVKVVVTTLDKDNHVISAVGGTASADKTEVKKGETINVTVTPNEGFELDQIDFGDGAAYYQEGKETSFTVPDDFTTGTGNLQIDVVFKALPAYTVTFDANGHGTAPAAQTVADGDTATEPTAPTASGWTFGGWYTEVACTTKFDFSTAITGDITLYAKWTENSVTPPATTPTVTPEEKKPATQPADTVTPENPAPLKDVSKAITTAKDDKDGKGTTFALLQAKGVAKSNTSVKLTWKKVKGAKKYIVYGNKCGKKNKYKKIKEVTGKSFTQKKLKKGTYYKYLVVAVNGDKALATSKTIHVATKGGKVGNHTGVKLSKTKLSLKKGKSKTIKATLKKGSLKVKNHRKTAWESDNISVAKVSSKGKITAVGKGTCYVYAYAQNGVFAKVKVTVN